MRSTLILASFLAVVPFVSASPTLSLAARQATPTIQRQVGKFGLVGCITDSEDNRVLRGDFTAPNGNTPGSCSDLCLGKGDNLAGVENSGASCFCDTAAETSINIVDESNCLHPCFVDSSTACGGFNFMLLYQQNQP